MSYADLLATGPKPWANLFINSVQIQENAHSGYVLTCQDSDGNSLWEPASGGGVSSVTAADDSILIGGTPSAVTVEATGDFVGRNITTGGSITGTNIQDNGTLTVRGSSSLDDGAITTSGVGDLTVESTITCDNYISPVPASTMNVGADRNTDFLQIGANAVNIGSSLGQVSVEGFAFTLAQITVARAYTGTGQTVTCTGTSTAITLAGFALAAGASTTINVLNNAVLPGSIILLTGVVNALTPATSGLTIELSGQASGTYQVIITNLSAVSITSGDYTWNMMTC